MPNNKLNILVIAKLSDKKLLSKISPIANLNDVNNIFLVRKTPLICERVRSYPTPKLFLASGLISEIYRLVTATHLLFTEKIDLIVGIHYMPHGFFSGILGKIFKKKYIVLLTEDPRLYSKNTIFSFIAKGAYMIGVRGSKSKKELTTHHVNESKIFIAPNLFDFSLSEKYSPKLADKREYHLATIGNLVREKRLDIIIKSAGLLKKHITNIKLLVLGEGPLKKELMDLTKTLNLTDNVVFAGQVTDIYRFLNQSKVFVLASETEGLPMAVIEALSTGLPCVLRNVGDLTDVATHQYNALIVNSQNPQEYADSCYRLLTDHTLYKKLAENASAIKKSKQYEYSSEYLLSLWRDIVEGL
ncbi:MAG: hypothetical protein ACD_22C00006G0001 [uncultured bacterium]|nr:MAG: hypothetical protein ACD_22C00006G0001 [uncultured bacterium]